MVKTTHSSAAVALTLVAFAGCGSSKPKPVTILNTETVERSIEQSIKTQRHLRSHVTCPSGVHQQKDLVFVCSAALQGGGTTQFRVRQTDDKGHVTYLGV